MTRAVPHAKVIVNPAAGARSTIRRWPAISRLLKHIGLSFDFEYTEAPGHAIELARTAAGDGYRYVVAVGGDGTIHEVANGILGSSGAADTTLGVVTTGTGGDFARSVGIPRHVGPACGVLVENRTSQVDVGVVDYVSKGQRNSRFFVNAAGAGFDAAVVDTIERSPRHFRGTLPYILGLIRTLARYKNKRVTLRMGDSTEETGIVTLVVANGGYFGGGMHVAPSADPRDGLLDIMVVREMSKIELLKAFPRVYKGTHVTHPKVIMGRANGIIVDTSERVLVHADGELIGEGPASFRIVPGALRVAG